MDNLPIICKTLYDNKNLKYKKYYKCNKCDFTCNTLFNLKRHTSDNHLSIKDKKELPYYCKLCDFTYISKLYYDRHLDSENHKEKESLIKLNNKNLDKNIKKYIDETINKMKNDIIKEISVLITKPKFVIEERYEDVIKNL
jgi:hypothetical protein